MSQFSRAIAADLSSGSLSQQLLVDWTTIEMGFETQ